MLKFNLDKNAIQSLGLSLLWVILATLISLLSGGNNAVTLVALAGGLYSAAHSWFTTNKAQVVAAVTKDQATANVLTDVFDLATSGSVPIVVTAATTTTATVITPSAPTSEPGEKPADYKPTADPNGGQAEAPASVGGPS